MDIPGSLTPRERAQLHHLLGEAIIQPSPESENVEEDEMPASTSAEVRREPDPPPPPSEVLDLNSGAGWWRGHALVLSAEQLRAVQKLCVTAIDSAMQAELARLRSEAGDAEV